MSKIKSIKHQLLSVLGIPLLIFVTIDTILSYFVTTHYVNVAYDRRLIDSAKSLAQEIEIRNGQPVVELPSAALDIFKWDEIDKINFKVVSDERGVLAGDSAVPEPRHSVTGWSQPVLFEDTLHGEPVRVVSIRFRYPDTLEPVTIYVAETTNKRRMMMRDILLADLIPQLMLIAATGVYLLVGIKRGLQPLHALAHEIARRSPQDLSPIPETEIFLEVRTLADKINDLLAQLQQAIATQDRFIGNAAHQLRTPLAGLKLQAERILRERDLNTMRPVFKQILECSDRMSHTIAQLLLLAKSEPIEGGHDLQPLDLCLLVREVCMDWAPRARKRQMELSFDGPDTGPTILGEETLLRELLANLLDNAISYGNDRGHVTVKLSSLPAPCLTVEDDGPGIPADEIDKVFERFYRARSSRGDGCGLGLAIVKEIADLHHARVQLGRIRAAGGTRITVTFPLCNDPHRSDGT